LTQFRKEFAKDPQRLFAWLGAGLRNARTSLSIGELTQLAFTAMTVNPKTVTNLVVPGTSAMVGATSIVRLSPSAGRLYSDLKTDGYIAPSVADRY
jgi:hypothetical protein